MGRLVVSYMDTCCLHFEKEGGSRFLRNYGTHFPNYRTSHPGIVALVTVGTCNQDDDDDDDDDNNNNNNNNNNYYYYYYLLPAIG